VPRKIAYCTNVHAGADLARTRANLLKYAVEVKRRVSPDAPMGVGLWLSASAARELAECGRSDEFADWLSQVGLIPFTFNGFPYCDFHQPVVKQKVYQPNWFEPRRLEYTLDLIKLLDALAPAGWQGSISTLPVAWRSPQPTPAQLHAAAEHLRTVAEQLRRLEETRGRLISVCLEPEPGCIVQRSADLVAFFRDYLLPGCHDEHSLLRYLRVCHDICHAVVMWEQQVDVLAAYEAAGIRVGKVQVSSAVCLPLDEIAPGERGEAVAQLAGFAEDRYLHQTTVRCGDNEPEFFDDLPDALERLEQGAALAGTWRVHFHVPVFLQRFGLLATSQSEIKECLRHCDRLAYLEHFEVETYAWSVLPEELRRDDLATGIAREMKWLEDAFNAYGKR
jgi:hypothetical protein